MSNLLQVKIRSYSSFYHPVSLTFIDDGCSINGCQIIKILKSIKYFAIFKIIL